MTTPHHTGPGPVPRPPQDVPTTQLPRVGHTTGPWSATTATAETAAPVTTGPRRRGVLLPVTATAFTAALLASLGTAAATGAFDTTADGAQGTAVSSTFATLGQDGSTVTVPVASSTVTNPDWQAVTDAVAPAVVSIQVTTDAGSGVGSGVVLSDDGQILTNNHVVEGAVDDTVQVVLADGRVYSATITGLDPSTDLAVVQLTDAPDDLVAAVFGDSDAVEVGEPVMAMGNPLGLSNTATTGIVSAVDRPVSTATTSGDAPVVTNAVQIDAAINPGNSGGPLFNASGEVIGISSSIATMSSGASSQGGSIGLGFAIPSNLATSIGAQLVEDGTAEHAFLGVSLSDGTGTADGTTRQGAVVEQVSAGSPAAEAGLEEGDVVVALDGKVVTGAESLTGFVRAQSADTEVTLTITRDDEALDVPVTLATKVEEATSNEGSTDDGSSGGFPGRSGSDDPGAIPDLGQLLPGRG
ncbi:S1C family serine protease [Sanguibacter suaedae]|uniref:Trypsin-like peptidase domain-containing protein n=1 Tax=Sanguibacter suaedae TaxID=2795737 RepID=A0A934I2F0_9MICO|nr:trypsin-like peptidase domain-containing protein [Sanguibacter suaedae]MBI9113958.1 trypsin-like peptidase domain-containing protein [Sanguibacter suaedae]